MALKNGRFEELLPSAEKEMLRYVELLTREPSAVTQADLDRLREAGFSDRAILEIALAAAYMNFVNRLAEGLGVELEPFMARFTR